MAKTAGSRRLNGDREVRSPAAAFGLVNAQLDLRVTSVAPPALQARPGTGIAEGVASELLFPEVRLAFAGSAVTAGFLCKTLLANSWQIVGIAPGLALGSQLLEHLRHKVAMDLGTTDQPGPLIPGRVDGALMRVGAGMAVGIAFLFPNTLWEAGPLFALWVALSELLRDPFERLYWRRWQRDGAPRLRETLAE